MQTPSAATLLDLWERGWGQPPVQQALLLLAATEPQASLEQIASLSIGQRDMRLLHLREHLFGTTIAGVTNCPHCNERVELSFNSSDICLAQDSSASAPASDSLTVDGYTLTVRAPNSLDLLALIHHSDPMVAEVTLLERCVQATDAAGTLQTLAQLPVSIQDAAIDQLATLDPQSDTQLELTCPACGHQWQSMFDIVSFLWNEINTWAYRVLREVHQLASAYGWREADILALSPARRQLYLELVGR